MPELSESQMYDWGRGHSCNMSAREKEIIVTSLERMTNLLQNYLKRIQKLERQVESLQKRKRK